MTDDSPCALEALSAPIARRIRVVFTDIDDTLTLGGKLPADAYEALWLLSEVGIDVVPVTGRPAGWCDLVARLWPVRGVVGENGALFMWRDERTAKMHTIYDQDEDERQQNAARRQAVADAILAAVPGTAIASDQAYRLHDVAIDYAEDVPPLGPDSVARILEIFSDHGATAKVSSIHVNGWFGNFDKRSMMIRAAREVLGFDKAALLAQAVYVGDSPNDAPAFAFFEQSVGVANLRPYWAALSARPRYLTAAPGGRGFREFVNHLLRLR